MKKVLSVFVGMLVLISAASASARDVYVTQNGKKYHTADCRWVKNRDARKMSEEEALKKGLAPCGRCLSSEGDLNSETQIPKAPGAKQDKGKK